LIGWMGAIVGEIGEKRGDHMSIFIPNTPDNLMACQRI
jgi:hypothetical protein